VDESYSCELGHGRLTERTCRTSQILHGYSEFPGLHQVIEVERKVKYMRRGEVVKETGEVQYAATNFSPRQAGAEVLDKLLRRHWMSENRHHYIRDTHWREDQQTWRSGHTAFVMFVLLAISMNLLRARSPCWTDTTPMTRRSMAVDYTLTAAPETMLRGPP